MIMREIESIIFSSVFVDVLIEMSSALGFIACCLWKLVGSPTAHRNAAYDPNDHIWCHTGNGAHLTRL